MKIILTQRAQIALEHLPPPDRKRADKLVQHLVGFPLSLELKGKYQKLNLPIADTYIAKIGEKYRALFRVTTDTVTVLEIAHHSRLDSFFHHLQRGAE